MVINLLEHIWWYLRYCPSMWHFSSYSLKKFHQYFFGSSLRTSWCESLTLDQQLLSFLYLFCTKSICMKLSELHHSGQLIVNFIALLDTTCWFLVTTHKITTFLIYHSYSLIQSSRVTEPSLVNSSSDQGFCKLDKCRRRECFVHF